MMPIRRCPARTSRSVAICPPSTSAGTTEGNESLLRPIFFVDKEIDDDIHEYVWSLIKGDKRFYAADPKEGARNYNYNDNTLLAKAIRSGERGAYWDILRRLDGV